MFDRVVRSVAAVNGMPRAAAGVRAAAGHGQDAGASCAPTSTARDPITGRPVMQEVDRGAHPAVRRRGASRPVEFDRSTPRLVEPDTEENLHRLFLDNHWTDKLPIVLPTEERVAAMLAAHQPQARRDRRAHAADALPRVLGVHGREGRGERGDGRRPAGVLPGDPGAGGDRRERARQHAPARRRRWRSSTARSATRSDERGHRRAWGRTTTPTPRSGAPRAALAEPPGRLGARAHLHGLAGQQLRLQQRHLRRERGAQPLGAVPRPARLPARPTARSASSAAAAPPPSRSGCASSTGASTSRNMLRGMDPHDAADAACSTRSPRASSSTAAASTRRSS